ncbi:thyroid transcription factor 1-associated protein 26 isoform X1 [Pongo pygmaeus]|uniref:CCDC59 isoform 2 n=1 Tax=Pongo abelii TaxID=9601 RepID=H2NI65_PONAB|nr:thyroid transcription factor 1-associated protein 26 isoform X1 [Pongo abelii]XP_054299458.1 thyroid transcription factor 1-associated protein 26 [Pongo pygmaeus]PNJ20435.1 CCDC59 isoform 2 [Pongo abelii]
MAPVRRSAKWRLGGIEARGEGVSTVGYRNKNVKQKTWRPNHPQAFVGSVREGQGFAFRRKLRIQQSYKKLLRKEKKPQTSLESQFTDRYPDNLKHLYLAEEERLRKQPRKVDHPLSEQVHQPLLEEQRSIDQPLFEDQCSFDQPQPEQCIKTVNCFTIPKKNKKKTSNQKAQEEYEQVQAKRAAKKQEFERRKQEREEAQRQYKKKKMEVFKILNKKTKKGQPNLNVQMEYLLQKIQEKC